MRIHLGHHFYGAGNLGDDFMVAGFLTAMQALAPAGTQYTSCVPFPLEPLRRRFPGVDWQPYEEGRRAEAIRTCDAWLGLGGSPFQSAQSRWFLDHLVGEAALCRQYSKPMFYLGVGVQTTAELEVPDIRELCAQASGIWTRDEASAERLAALRLKASVHAASDLAHVYFRSSPPPPPRPHRLTLVANFDYAGWPGREAFCRAAKRLPTHERIWLAQESRELPGAEKALFGALPDRERRNWTLVAPDEPGVPLTDVLGKWPSAEWLVTARYHAALAGAWSGSKIVVIATNEKLRGAAGELATPSILPDAGDATVVSALEHARPAARPERQANAAFAACEALVAAIRAS